MHLKKKHKFSILEGKKLFLPQIKLDMMEPNVCLVSTKLDFVTILTDFCDAMMWVCDSFHFGPNKIPTAFVFLQRKPAFRLG